MTIMLLFWNPSKDFNLKYRSRKSSRCNWLQTHADDRLRLRRPDCRNLSIYACIYVYACITCIQQLYIERVVAVCGSLKRAHACQIHNARYLLLHIYVYIYTYACILSVCENTRCIYIYIYIYAYICIYRYTHIHHTYIMYIHTYIMYVCQKRRRRVGLAESCSRAHTCAQFTMLVIYYYTYRIICIYIYACILSVCIYVYMYIYIYIYMHTFTCTYIHITLKRSTHAC